MHIAQNLLFCFVTIVATGCSKSPESAAPAPKADAANASPAQPQAKDAHGHDHGDEETHAEKPGHEGHGEDGHGEDGHGHAENEHGHVDEESEADAIRLTDAQIAAAGIEIAVVRAGAAGAITVPAVIAADPEKSAIVVAAVGGRITSLARNLGEPVKAGDTLAIIESREAAELQADLEARRQQAALAEATLEREERLFAQKVSAEQDVLQARAAAAEARIRLQLAQQRLGTTGGAGGALNRVVVRAPLAGHVVARGVGLGQAVPADAELFRIADLSTLAVELALPPHGAAAVAVGATVSVAAGTRDSVGRLAFVSPVIDPDTRQVRAIALLPNPDGLWRVGETVQAMIAGGGDAGHLLSVPKIAVQTVEDKPSVFVRTAEGFAVRHLQLGPSSGAFVVVRSGIEEGDRIAVKNSYVLKAEAGKGEGGGHHDH